MSQLFGFIVFLCACGVCAGDLFCDFSKPHGIKLHGSAVIKNGELVLDGRGYAEITGGDENFKIPSTGLTVSLLAKTAPRKKGSSWHQVFFSKGREWSFWRMPDGVLAAIFRDKTGKWHGGVKAGRPVADLEYAHYVLVFEPVIRQGQGEKGFNVKIYLNSQLQGQVTAMHVEPFAERKGAVLKLGTEGNPGTAFRGNIRSFALYKRALSENEIEKITFSHAPLVKPAGLPSYKTGTGLKSALDAVSGEDAALLKTAMQRAAGWGADQEVLTNALRDFAAGRKQNVFEIAGSGRLKAVILLKGSKTAHPLAGAFDRKAGREIFGRKSLSWRIRIKENGREQVLADTDSKWKRTIKKNSAGVYDITWSIPGKLICRSRLSVSGPRIEYTFAVENLKRDLLLIEVENPGMSFARLASGNDKLVLPFMSGIELADPVHSNGVADSQNYVYPTSNQNMQFSAYYDDRSGIYFAWEDPSRGVKRQSFQGRRGDLDAEYVSSAAYAPGAEGGNSFALPGAGAIEVFDGNWFEAGQIYKRFLKNKALWFRSLPRRDTPSWYQNIGAALAAWVAPGWYSFERMADDVLRMKNYLEVPVLFASRNWFDFRKGGYPHFYPKDEMAPAHKKIQDQGVRVAFYIDDRLWEENDGPGTVNRRNWLFDPIGRECAVVNRNGYMQYENYRSFYAYRDPESKKIKRISVRMAIMCPGAQQWHQWLRDLCIRVSSYKADLIYHDQVSAATPKDCFSTSHGHNWNDPYVWCRDGFVPLLKEIRKHTPGKSHTSEDASEAYSDVLDGFEIWRWTHQQVPLFQSIYCGRVQYSGRTYGDTLAPRKKAGSWMAFRDANAFFAKMAEQVVHGEIPGKIYTDGDGDWRHAGAMVFFKRMAHMRMALLKYFNGAEMTAPVRYKVAPPDLKTFWNAYQGGSGGGGWITQPAVRSSTWLDQKSGMRMAFFVNSSGKTVEIQPLLGNFTDPVILNALPETQMKYNDLNIKLAPYGYAVVLSGPEKTCRMEAERIFETMKKTAAFTPPGWLHEK